MQNNVASVKGLVRLSFQKSVDVAISFIGLAKNCGLILLR